MRPSRFIMLSLLSILAGCAAGSPSVHQNDAAVDARVVRVDSGTGDSGAGDSGTVEAGTLDAGTVDASAPDASAEDGGAALDGGPMDGGTSSMDGGRDGSTDASMPDAGRCGSASSGHTVVLDGIDDLGGYPATQVLLPPGAPLASWDGFGLTWDAVYLYVTMVTSAFSSSDRPLHVYLQTGSALGAAVPSTGKPYSALTPALPFSPTHLIAVRRVSQLGDLPPYNGIYQPADGWADRVTALEAGADTWVSADNHTLSVRVPWSALGCPSAMRLSVHVVNASVGNEWKDLVPESATPWVAPGGGFYEVDLAGPPNISGWTER